MGPPCVHVKAPCPCLLKFAGAVHDGAVQEVDGAATLQPYKQECKPICRPSISFDMFAILLLACPRAKGMSSRPSARLTIFLKSCHDSSEILKCAQDEAGATTPPH